MDTLLKILNCQLQRTLGFEPYREVKVPQLHRVLEASELPYPTLLSKLGTLHSL